MNFSLTRPFTHSMLAGTAAVTLLLAAGCDADRETADNSPDATETTLQAENEVAAPPTRAEVEREQTPETPEPSESENSPLSIGDPAPQLRLGTYLTGQPLQSDLAKGDAVHVVEFWATWCGPCKVSMPHLASLQDEYGEEVKIVGITEEDAGTVRDFLAQQAPSGDKWNDVITYRLATDADSATYAAYMRAAGQNGIPTAFIVGREGIIEWIGHPGRIDEPLQRVVDGSWDRAEAIKQLQMQERMRDLTRQLQQWMATQEYDKALNALDEVEQEFESSMELKYARLMVLQRAERHEQASELRSQMIDESWENADLLSQLAWMAAISESEHGLQDALRAAERAVELQDGGTADSLDTLARVHYEMGDLDTAIKFQRQAVEKNDGQYQQIDDALEKYLSEQEAASPQADKSSESDNADAADTGEQSDQQPAQDESQQSEQENADADSEQDEASDQESTESADAVEEVSVEE